MDGKQRSGRRHKIQNEHGVISVPPPIINGERNPLAPAESLQPSLFQSSNNLAISGGQFTSVGGPHGSVIINFQQEHLLNPLQSQLKEAQRRIWELEKILDFSSTQTEMRTTLIAKSSTTYLQGDTKRNIAASLSDHRDDSPYESPETSQPQRQSDDDDEQGHNGMEYDHEDDGLIQSESGSEEDDWEEEAGKEEARRKAETWRLEEKRKAEDEQIQMNALELERLRLEVARLEEEAQKKGEQIRRMEEEVRKMEEAAKRKEEEIQKKESETEKKEEQARKYEEKLKEEAERTRTLQEEAQRIIEAARAAGENFKRLEEETQRKKKEIRERETALLAHEEEVKHREAEAKRKEENARRKEEEARRKEEDTREREAALLCREEGVKRREAEAKKKEDEARREQQAKKLKEEEKRQAKEARQKAENAKLEAARQEEAKIKADRIRLEQETKRQQQEAGSGRPENEFDGIDPRIVKEQERLWNELKRQVEREEEFRKREEDIKRHREERKRNDSLGYEAKHLSREDVQRVFEHHERLWARLPNIEELTWNDFPWPMLKPANNPDEISSAHISWYFQSPFWPDKDKEKSKTPKDRINEHMRKWHPDRFETKMLPRVGENEKVKVKLGAGNVWRYLSDLLRKENESSSSINIFGD